ncbi:uncharacterized protein LOC144005902 isoform X2 [Festucalex cinctus]
MTSEFPGWFSSLSERRLTAARKQAVAANETLWSKILQQQSEKDPGNTRVPLFQQRLIASRFHKRNKDLLCAGRLGRKPSHAVMASRVTICHPVVNPHLLSAPPPSGPQETIRWTRSKAKSQRRTLDEADPRSGRDNKRKMERSEERRGTDDSVCACARALDDVGRRQASGLPQEASRRPLFTFHLLYDSLPAPARTRRPTAKQHAVAACACASVRVTQTNRRQERACVLRSCLPMFV